MKKCACFLLIGSVLSISASAFAESVNISIGSTGGALDDAALRTVRQVIGHAIASSTVDTFIVYSPRVGSIPIEGGLSACAEAGFNTNNEQFTAFINELQSIHPKSGTFYNIERTASCNRK
jgi:hypothetical protein